MHVPVMLKEVIEYWPNKPNGIYVDCTFGSGGHSQVLLNSYPESRIIAFDYDEQAINRSQQIPLLNSLKLTLINDNFVNLERNLTSLGIQKIDGFLFDLGLSTEQLSSLDRGFSYRLVSPLDMRASNNLKLNARGIINNYSFQELADIFYYYGEEWKAKMIARKICERRKKEEIVSTQQLVNIIASCFPKKSNKHPARKVFQALRIVINKELDNLILALEASIKYLEVGGKILVISYHSLEDRIAKQFFKKLSINPSFQLITKKPLTPQKEEINNNHQARSAKLRILQKIN